MSHLGFFKDPAGLADGSYAFHSLKGGGANFSFRDFKPDFLHQFHLFNFLLKFQYIKLHLTSGGIILLLTLILWTGGGEITVLEIIFLKKFSVHCKNTLWIYLLLDALWLMCNYGCSHHIVYFWTASRRQILNFIRSKLCTLMYWHDINIIIIKHWLVLYNTCWIMSILDRRRNSLRHPLCYVLSWHVITEWNLWWCNFRGTSRHWSGEMKSFWINNMF